MVYLFHLPIGCGNHPLHFFTSQQSPSVLHPYYQQRTCCLRKEALSPWEAYAGMLSKQTWRRVTACCIARHILRFCLISALTLPHYLCSFAVLKEMLAQIIIICFFHKSNNKNIFLDTVFELVRGSSSGYRLVTWVVKLMKSLLLSLVITGILLKGKWSLNGKKENNFQLQ